MHFVTGTWSDAAGQFAGTIVKKVDNANQTGVVNIPIQSHPTPLPCRVPNCTSIEIDFEITVAGMTAVTPVVNKVTRGADGAVAVVAAPAFSYDTGHDTAAERIDVDQHKMTLTITTPFWVDNDVYVLVELSVDQAGDGGLFEVLGAFANYTLRA